MRLRVTHTIDAAPEAVWSVVERIERHVDWMSDAVRITFVGDRTRGVGTAFDCVTRIGPLRTNDRMCVTEWAPGRALGIRHEGLVRGTGRFTLRARRGGRTRFTWTERLQFPWWMGGPAASLVARPLLRRVWTRNLRRLGRIVEGT